MSEEPKSELIICQADDGDTRLQVRRVRETVWLTLNQLADLFQRDKSVVSRHIRNVFKDTPRQRLSRNAPRPKQNLIGFARAGKVCLPF
ncbi:MAG: hypothetical protein AAB354_11900 [candidate division KSB1 bacterium]